MFAGAVDGSEEEALEELEEGEEEEEEDLPVFSLQGRPESASTSTSG